MMACSYLSASGSAGMKAASTSAACWTPPTMPGCLPEIEGPPMLPTHPYMRPPGLTGMLPAPGLEPSVLPQPPLGLAPPQSSLMPTPRGLTPTQVGLTHEPALDLSTTTPSLKLPTKSSPSDDESE